MRTHVIDTGARPRATGANARQIPPWGVALLAVLLCSACGEDPKGSDETDTSAEVEVTPEAFTVTIEATALTGNVPQRIGFSASAEGAELSTLALTWTIDGQPYTTEPSFEIVFNRAGRTAIGLLAESADGGRAETSVTVDLLGCGQLRFDRFTLDSPIEVAPGGVARVRLAQLINDGDAIERPFDVALALSLDETWEPELDLEIGRVTIPSMPQGLTTTSAFDLAGQAFTVPADLAPETYYAFLVADPDGVVNECQELDNQLAASNALVVDPEANKLPDLRIENLAVPEGTTVSQGRTLSWTYAISNAGEADARQFRFGFWISQDTVLDEGDLAIAPPEDNLNRVQLMPAGLSLGFFKTWLVPEDLADGDYYILGKVDALETVAESDEDNNLAVSVNPFTMRYEAPDCFDFELLNVRVTPLTTYWGGTVAATLTVRNEGAQDAPAGNIARAYLSLTPTLSPANAQVVGNFVLGAVPAGETATFEVLVPIGSDLPVLPHYLGVVLDPTSAFGECSESNNAALFPDPIRINALAEVDLVATNLAYHPRVVTAGQAIKVDYTIENRGTSAATSFQAAIVLSADTAVSAGSVASGVDVVVDRLTVPLLMAGEARSAIRDVVIPGALDHRVGTWYVAVLADVDGFLAADIDPANNTRVSPDALT
ncbi:MAG TPA: CARDB domain-containing protein, partial [Myxococcota bacterium]|nr:CARDB domain-containing protein [Myxococcota bacterium]